MKHLIEAADLVDGHTAAYLYRLQRDPAAYERAWADLQKQADEMNAGTYRSPFHWYKTFKFVWGGKTLVGKGAELI